MRKICWYFSLNTHCSLLVSCNNFKYAFHSQGLYLKYRLSLTRVKKINIDGSGIASFEVQGLVTKCLNQQQGLRLPDLWSILKHKDTKTGKRNPFYRLLFTHPGWSLLARFVRTGVIGYLSDMQSLTIPNTF